MSSAPASKARQAAKGRAEAFLIMASGKWKREMTRLLRFPNAANPAIVGSHRPVLKKLADKVMDPTTTKAQMEQIATLAQQAASSMNMQGVEQGLAALGSGPTPKPWDTWKTIEDIQKEVGVGMIFTKDMGVYLASAQAAYKGYLIKKITIDSTDDRKGKFTVQRVGRRDLTLPFATYDGEWKKIRIKRPQILAKNWLLSYRPVLQNEIRSLDLSDTRTTTKIKKGILEYIDIETKYEAEYGAIVTGQTLSLSEALVKEWNTKNPSDTIGNRPVGSPTASPVGSRPPSPVGSPTDLAKARTDLAKAEADLAAAKAAAKAELQAKNVEIKSLREALANASSDQAKVIQSKLDECEKEKGRLKTNLEKAKGDLTAVQTDLGEERIESNNLKTLNKNLKEGIEALEKEKNELEERLNNASTDEEKAAIQKELRECIERKVDLEEELTGANNAKAQAEEENRRLRMLNAEMQAEEKGGDSEDEVDDSVKDDDSASGDEWESNYFAGGGSGGDEDYDPKKKVEWTEVIKDDNIKGKKKKEILELFFKETGEVYTPREIQLQSAEELRTFLQKEDDTGTTLLGLNQEDYDDWLKERKVQVYMKNTRNLQSEDKLPEGYVVLEDKVEYAGTLDPFGDAYSKTRTKFFGRQFLLFHESNTSFVAYYLSEGRWYPINEIKTVRAPEDENYEEITLYSPFGFKKLFLSEEDSLKSIAVKKEEWDAFSKGETVPEPEPKPEPFADFDPTALGTDIKDLPVDKDLPADEPVKVFYGEGRHPDPYWYRRIEASQSPLLENVVKVEYKDLFGRRKGKQITDKIHWEDPSDKKKDFQQEAKNGNLDFWVRLTEGGNKNRLYNGKKALYDAFMAVDPNTAVKDGKPDTFKAQDGRGKGYPEYPYLVGVNEIVPIVIDTYVKVSEERKPYPSVFFEEVLSRYAREGTTYAILTPAPNKGVTKVPSYYENTNWEKQHSVLIDKYQSDRYNFKKVQYYGLEYNEFIRGALGRPRVEMTEGDAERCVPALPSIRIPHRHEL